VEAIVDEGEHVRLARATKSFADEFRAPAPSMAKVEEANASSPATSSPDPHDRESQPVEASSVTLESGQPIAPASGIEPPAVRQTQGIAENHRDLEPELLGPVQPEPLAEYSGSRFELKRPPAAVVTSPAGKPTRALGEKGRRSAVETLGYVEKAGGEKEAIVEVLNQVYLVHEGDSFAGKYRAVQVTPSSVEIVEESSDGSPSPDKIEPDSKDVRAPLSRLSGPIYPRAPVVPPRRWKVPRRRS